MKRKALYPGTFDPITRGHEDLMRRASSMFDTLIVGVSSNPGKSPIFSIEERVDMIKNVLEDVPNIFVIGYTELTVQLAEAMGCSAMIRGLRAVTDFEYEFQIAHINSSLSPDIETVFLPSKVEYTFVSSSMVRELARYGASVREFVHPLVGEKLVQKIGLI